MNGVKVGSQDMNFMVNSSRLAIFSVNSHIAIHVFRTDWEPTVLVSPQPMKSDAYAHDQRTRASCNSIDLLQASSGQFICCEQTTNGLEIMGGSSPSHWGASLLFWVMGEVPRAEVWGPKGRERGGVLGEKAASLSQLAMGSGRML